MEKENILKMGIIGLGHQATCDHIPALQKIDNIKLVGVVDIDKKKLKSFRIENPGILATESFDELIEENKPDFVLITLPHHLHCEFTKKALENNIHVLKEKPFSVSLKDGITIKNIADSRNLDVMTAMQRRFIPSYSELSKYFNKIGKAFFVDARYTFFTDCPHTGWRGKKKFAGGGCVIDMGYHLIDLIILYFGLPDEVFLETSCQAVESAKYDAEDTAVLILKYKEKELWSNVVISRVIPPKQEYIKIYGTKGILFVDKEKIELSKIDGTVIKTIKHTQPKGKSQIDQIRYFSSVISKKAANELDPDCTLNHSILIEAAYQSKKKGRYVSIKKIN